MLKIMLMAVAFLLGIAIASIDKILIIYDDIQRIAASKNKPAQNEYRLRNEAQSLNETSAKLDGKEFSAGQYQRKAIDNNSGEAKHSELIYHKGSAAATGTLLTENIQVGVKAPEAENTQLAVKAPEAENLQLTVKA
ncbi:hypothetical protein M7963_23445, partial [Enterobacter roggenkampii]|uniref:hypothetical protein n=1 Tax=Enterobacter roggenkampii TaxID=1812935 RepID=UPI0022383674